MEKDDSKRRKECFVFPIKKEVWQGMIAHCFSNLPYEACGLLSGRNGRADTLWVMENVKRSPVSFEMDMEQIRQVFWMMERRGEEFVGIFHSHPTASPYPSTSDIAHASYPDQAYIIVSLANGTANVGCYRIVNRRVIPLSLKLV